MEGERKIQQGAPAKPSPEVASPPLRARCLFFFSFFFSTLSLSLFSHTLSSSPPTTHKQTTTGARLPLPQLRRPDPRAAEGHRRVDLRQPRHRLDQAHRAVLRARADVHAVQVRRRRRARFRPHARDRDLPRDAVRVPGQVRGAAERRVQGQVKKKKKERSLDWCEVERRKGVKEEEGTKI